MTDRVCQYHHQQYAVPVNRRGAEDSAQEVDHAVRTVAATHPLALACQERALCCCLLLWRRGLPAKLVVGVNLYPLTSHCWCELEERTLSDDADTCARFMPVLTYQ
jgi:Transglutaminase-like superfamily